MSDIKQLQSENEILRRDLKNYRQEAQTLMSAALLLNTTLDLKALLRIILEQSAVLADAEASSLALIDVHKPDELIFEVSVGASSEVVETVRMPFGKGIIGWVIKNDEPVMIDDCATDHRFYGDVDKQTDFHTRNIIAVPLKTKHGVIGGVEVLNKKEGRKFTDNDLRILLALSSQAALAIENARLYQTMIEEKNRIQSIVNSIADGIIVTDRFKEIVMMNPSARKIWDLGSEESRLKLSAVMEDVNCLHQEGNFDLVLMKPENMILSNNVTILEDGAGRFSGHVISSRNITDVRERENARMEFVNLLAVQILEKINPLPTREEFDIQLRLKLDEIRAMIQKFTYFTDLISGPLRLNRFRHTLGEVIFSSIKQVQFKLDHAQVKVNVALENEKLEIEVDEEKLSESLCIVLNNAIKCTPAGGTIRIKGFYKEDMVRVIVADQGPGITPDVLQTVFDSETLQKKVSEDGEFSIGLLYVRHVVDAHGGSVEIASEIGVGTEVKLSVPIMLH